MVRSQSKETEGILKHLEHNYVDGRFEMTAIMIDEGGSSTRQEFYGYIPRTEIGKEVYLCQWTTDKRRYRKLTLTQKLTIEEDNYQIVARSKQNNSYIL